VLETYHDLTNSDYTINLTTGEHLDRFQITFGTKEVENNNNNLTKIDMHFSNDNRSIIIKNPENKVIHNVKLLNILGQSVYISNTEFTEDYKEIKIKHLNSGAYLIKIRTNKGIITKKVIAD